MTHRTARISAFAALLSLTLAACGDGSGTSAVRESEVSVPGTGGPGTVPGDDHGGDESAGGGWIGGEPDWDGSSSGGRGEADASAAYDMPGDVAAPAPVMAETTSRDGFESNTATPLRAGSVDDNADFVGYLAYLQRIRDLGIPARNFDPSGRIVLTVTGANGLPVAGQIVTVTPAEMATPEPADEASPTEAPRQDAPALALRTTADGQVIFLPAEWPMTADGTAAASYMFSVNTDPGTPGVQSVIATPGTTASLQLAEDGGRTTGMAVDVLFLLDVTGSMGDEIAQLKTTISDVAGKLAALPQTPDVRFGMTLFRDEGDLFVTSTYDFTGDVGAFQSAIDDVVADGGGDTPEAVDEAFAAALSEPSWRDPATTVQLVFLVGDAAPQVGRQVATPYTESIMEAATRGITVHAVAASNTDDSAEVAFRHIAQGTGGRFVFLTYGAGGTATGSSTDIASTDYEELSLDDLVVRLVGEELAALTGTPFVAPVPDPVPTTNPQGQ